MRAVLGSRGHDFAHRAGQSSHRSRLAAPGPDASGWGNWAVLREHEHLADGVSEVELAHGFCEPNSLAYWKVMEIIFLIIIVILFIIPSFMAMRKQRQRQNDMQSLQNSLQNGDRIVTAGGVHGVVRGTTDTSVDLEVSPGVTLTFDKMAVVRTESEAQNLARGGADNAGEPQRDNGENNNDDGFNGGEGEQPSNR